MSDYTQITNFTAKDSLSSGDPEKVILGADVDGEFSAIETAIATKYDSTDRASTAEAEALTTNTKLLTPSTLNDVLAANAGMLQDIQALADPNADTILGWDDSAGGVINFTIGTGLAATTTTIGLSFLGLEALTDPGADRIYFWDDSDSASEWLAPGNGLEIATNTLGVADQAASTSLAIAIASGSFNVDLQSLAASEGRSLSATAKFLVDDGGTLTSVAVQDMGLRVQTSQTTQTLALADMNSIMVFNGTATLTIPTNASVDLPVGVPIVLKMNNASQELTVTADTGVTLDTVYHPGGTAAASDTVLAGGTALLYQTADDDWSLTGDIKD